VIGVRLPRARLRTLCGRAGLSLRELAEETGITDDALRKIESGRREPLITTALRIARVLGAEVEDIFPDRRAKASALRRPLSAKGSDAPRDR
jgi:transcriptional regulator with XRE-family HTH domain